MKKSQTKNRNGNHDYDNMSDQKSGSSLFIKSHEDFNNQHPEHDENGLVNGNTNPQEKNKGTDMKKSSDVKTTETKSKKSEATKTYTCSMHPEVISDKPGKCPKCGMELIEK